MGSFGTPFFCLSELTFPIFLLSLLLIPRITYALFKGHIMHKKQLSLNVFKGKQGGRRPASGRKRIHSKGVSHRLREKVNSRTPVHINFRYKTHIRNKDALKVLKRALINARKMGLRVIHFSMMTNHIHVIAEVESNKLLTKGMRSLTITFAKGLKKGSIQVQRYHLHVLKTLRETKNAISYVLFNQQKHDEKKNSVIDHYSSVLNLPCALELIRQFASKNKVTLRLDKIDKFWINESRCFLSIKALDELGRPKSPL